MRAGVLKSINLFVPIVLLGGGVGTLTMNLLSGSADQNDLQAIEASLRHAPPLHYPKVDLRNRPIPSFDQLLVFPDCTSCSNFRLKCAELAKSTPSKTYLVLTPGTQQLDLINARENCYVAILPTTKEFSSLAPGVYNR